MTSQTLLGSQNQYSTLVLNLDQLFIMIKFPKDSIVLLNILRFCFIQFKD